MIEIAVIAPALESIPFGVHPGQVIRECLSRKHLTQERAAGLLRMSRRNLNAIITGHRSISPALAIKLAGVLSTTAEYWITLQGRYDVFRLEARAKQIARRVGGGG